MGEPHDYKHVMSENRTKNRSDVILKEILNYKGEIERDEKDGLPVQLHLSLDEISALKTYFSRHVIVIERKKLNIKNLTEATKKEILRRQAEELSK